MAVQIGFSLIAMCALWQTAQGQGTAIALLAYALRGQISGKVFKERFRRSGWRIAFLVPEPVARWPRMGVGGWCGRQASGISEKAKFEKARDATSGLAPETREVASQGSLEISRRQVACVCARLQCVDRATEGNEEIQLSHDGKEQDRYEGYLAGRRTRAISALYAASR